MAKTQKIEQIYKNIIVNLTKNLSCDQCPYKEDCSIDFYLNSDNIVPPCSTLIVMAERWREINGKN